MSIQEDKPLDIFDIRRGKISALDGNLVVKFYYYKYAKKYPRACQNHPRLKMSTATSNSKAPSTFWRKETANIPVRFTKGKMRIENNSSMISVKTKQKAGRGSAAFLKIQQNLVVLQARRRSGDAADL